MAQTFDTREAEASRLDPLAEIDPAVSGAFDGRDPLDLLDASDLDVAPFALDAGYEFAGIAASVDAFAELCSELDGAEQAWFAVNRAMAAQLDATRRALDLAARNPAVYLRAGQLGAPDAAELAVRAAATELSMRLHVPVGTIRNRAHEAAVLHDRLPEVWARFAAGAASYTDARVAVDAAAGFAPGDARLAELDEELAAVIGTVTTTRFRQRARTMLARLERDRLEARLARAYAQRRVVVEHVDDGMAWVSLYTSQLEAAKISARLDATARRDSGAPGEVRTLEQLRADTATGWLTGAGTPTGARTEIIVTVPLLTLTGTAGLGDEVAKLDGVGPIDDTTARQLFADAPSFLRLAIDPITAAPLALDRTRYRPTNEQRRWLALVHGRCTRPGCNRLAVSADLDHLHDWQHGGLSNPENLCPACRGDHRLKHSTRFRQTKNADDTVTWHSPTGRSYTDPPPF
ncbi:HNH endonuclease signature motif containing protein [Agromyces italicus]|uniref:HNH endonuclease signature motif containing protein n=1 Tax=Agromyces italicus TaxID=279572 RepID=UPI0003B36551|nr:HNH endonuclease signature motif containing protein [Agromyces italicus]